MNKYCAFGIVCAVALASGALGLKIGGEIGFEQSKEFYTRKALRIIGRTMSLTRPLIANEHMHEFELIEHCFDQQIEIHDDLLTTILNNLGSLEQDENGK